MQDACLRRLVEELSVRAFIEEAASAQPIPGGGGMAALCAAAAAAMMEMTLRLTVGKKKFADVDAEAGELLGMVAPIRARLVDLIVLDAAGYSKVATAFKLPRGTDEERSRRREQIKSAMTEAMDAPLEILRCCSALGGVIGEVLRIGNPNLIGDVGVAAATLPGAARAAGLNVLANIGALCESESISARRDVADAVDAVERICKDVAAKVEEKICPAQSPEST